MSLRNTRALIPGRFLSSWTPPMFWMFFIFWMSTDSFSAQNSASFIEPILRFMAPSISQQRIDAIHGTLRKLGHFAEYLILGMLLFRAFRQSLNGKSAWRCALYSLLAGALYAAGDEFHQSFVSTRTASPVDVGIDIVGGFFAQAITLVWVRFRLREADGAETHRAAKPFTAFAPLPPSAQRPQD